jgi:hypothetical protein
MLKDEVEKNKLKKKQKKWTESTCQTWVLRPG